MSRRHSAEKREITPDAKYGDEVVAKFMNAVMYEGKKFHAERIVYGAFDQIEAKLKSDPLVAFKQALENVSPAVEVRSRRVGGATYQVRLKCAASAVRLLPSAGSSQRARGRNDKTMEGPSVGRTDGRANNRGNAVKKREDTHRMAEANRAFAHYRW